MPEDGSPKLQKGKLKAISSLNYLFTSHLITIHHPACGHSIRLCQWPHQLTQMGHVHPGLKQQAKRLLMRHNPGHKRRIANRPLGVLGDCKRAKHGCRGDIERSMKSQQWAMSHEYGRCIAIPIVSPPYVWTNTVRSTWRWGKTVETWAYRTARFDPMHVLRRNPNE